MSLAVVFPGQGSQKPGMGKQLYDTRAEARKVFEVVATATGVDTTHLCFELDEAELRQTQNAQLALFTVSVAAFQCLQSHLQINVRIDALAGHSVGEYAAIACAGHLSIDLASKLVQKRGLLMAEAGKKLPGTMVAVLGLEVKAIQACLDKIGTDQVVVANDNCPGQVVISGAIEAIPEASKALSEAGAKRLIPLNVSGAFHSPLMAEAASNLSKSLDSVSFEPGGSTGPVYSNVTSEAVGREKLFPQLLSEQLVKPVRWTEIIQNMMRDRIDIFIECGVGDVLSGLIRRIDKSARCLKVQDLDSLELAVAEIRP